MESEPGGLKVERPRLLLVAGTMEEITVEVGAAIRFVDWLLASSFVQDPGFPALGRRVRGRVGIGTRMAERSVLHVAMYPTRAHINPKLQES